jgi:hypothetical protein
MNILGEFYNSSKVRKAICSTCGFREHPAQQWVEVKPKKENARVVVSNEGNNNILHAKTSTCGSDIRHDISHSFNFLFMTLVSKSF